MKPTIPKNRAKASGVRKVASMKDRFVTRVRYSRFVISQSLFIVIAVFQGATDLFDKNFIQAGENFVEGSDVNALLDQLFQQLIGIGAFFELYRDGSVFLIDNRCRFINIGRDFAIVFDVENVFLEL